MTRVGVVVAGGALAVVVLGAILASRPARGGPLQEDVPSNAVTFSVTAGTRFTYGGLQVHNAGDEAAVLDGVSLRGATAGLRIQDASVLPIRQISGGLWFNHHRYPPPGVSPDRLQPLAGLRMPAAQASGDGMQVLLALTVPSGGVFEFQAIAIDYHVGGRRYEAVFPFAMRVCAPPVQLGGCPGLDPAE